MKYIIDTNVWISYFLWKTPILDNLISSITQSGEIFASEETLEEFFKQLIKKNLKITLTIFKNNKYVQM